MNTIQPTESIDVTADKDYRKSHLFKSMARDVLYNGDESIHEISEETDIAPERLMSAFEQITMGNTISSREFDDWDLDSLIDYIITTHHQYAKTNAVIIHDLAQKVANDHCRKHPELIKLTTEIFLFFHDLLNHMKKEEQVLFPNIKELVKNKNYSKKGVYTTFGLIRESVKLMQKEHQGTVEYIKQFHEITNKYMLPDDACSSYKNLFKRMKEFEANFLLHVYLENNILFPKALVEDEELDENPLLIENEK